MSRDKLEIFTTEIFYNKRLCTYCNKLHENKRIIVKNNKNISTQNNFISHIEWKCKNQKTQSERKKAVNYREISIQCCSTCKHRGYANDGDFDTLCDRDREQIIRPIYTLGICDKYEGYSKNIFEFEEVSDE